MKKAIKITISSVVGVVILVLVWIAFCGFQWGWGPFCKLHDIKTGSYPGNAEEYAMKNVTPLENSPLKGKEVFFLGSSVTYGAASKSLSFADYIEARNECHSIKEAVSGTTLVDKSSSSYVSRLKKTKTEKVDLFVCQLSTNDATQKKPLGEMSASKNMDDFDTKTVAGAIEYIIEYAKKRWDCPVSFYTNPKYDSELYGDRVTLLLQIAKKWDIQVIDFWNDAEFNNISEEERQLYRADSIHPTQAGYLKWWTPRREKDLYQIVQQRG